MTNFDPGCFLMLLAVIPAVVAGAVPIAVAQVAARLGYGKYETNVTAILAVMIVGWIGAALVISTGMLQILAVTLAMVGAYVATRSITAASYGWMFGVVLLFAVFIVLSVLGVYKGVDQTGVPQDLISQYLFAFYYGGLLVFGAVVGKAVQIVQHRWRLYSTGAAS